MDVLKFKIYKVTVESDKKSDNTIIETAKKLFKKKKEAAYIGESPLYLLPEKDIDKFILEKQHEEARKFISNEVMKRHLN